LNMNDVRIIPYWNCPDGTCVISGTSTKQSFDDIRAHTDIRISF